MMLALASSLLVGLAFQQTAPEEVPAIQNARLVTRSAAGGLEREFRALVAGRREPAWIGYAVPVVEGHHSMCGSDARCCGCALESDRSSRSAREVGSPVRLESSPSLLVLFRVAEGRVEKVRSFSGDCRLDAGGLALFWLTGVRPVQSLELLRELVAGGEDGRTEGAWAAIALHLAPEADGVLEVLAGPGRPEKQREKAAFWLGTARGRRGFEILDRLVREDGSARFREKAVFALHVSREPAAVDSLIRVGRRDSSPRVRGQALFWLAQKAGEKVGGAIRQAVEDDPEIEVKKKAVFALSQLPADEGVPLLIQVARTHASPAVRKQAVFWLGQSNDARALAFFEAVLR